MKASISALKSALIVVVVASLTGCQEAPAPSPEARTQTAPTPGETGQQKPGDATMITAKAAEAPAPKKTGEAPSAKPETEALAAPGAGQAAPDVPGGTSAPPTVAEWQAASSANTVGANSAPRDCELKVVREWLKVNCTGNIKEVTNMEGFGKKGSDYFELVTPGKVADLVVRMKQGQAIKARILREGQSASLFVNWPQQSPKPSIVALQIYNG